MKKLILLVALALAWPAWPQAPAQKPQPVKRPAKAAKVNKATSKRHQDARHCLQRANNDAIIRCAEDYL